jgi:diguanylate cyclase (GGDEF)-like protein
MLCGAAVTGFATFGPDVALDRLAQARFQAAALASAQPVLDRASAQYDAFETVAESLRSGAQNQGQLVQDQQIQGLDPALLTGRNDESLFGKLVFVDSSTRTSPQFAESLNAVGLDAVPGEFTRAQLGLGSVADMQHLGLYEGSSAFQGASSASGERLNQLVIALPIASRGWLLSLVREPSSMPEGLVQIIELGDDGLRKTVSGLGIENSGRRNRRASFDTTLDTLNIDVSVAGPWRYGVGQKTWPKQTGGSIGILTFLLAGFVGLRQHRRNQRVLQTALSDARSEARTDSLTGLANRLALLEVISACSAQAVPGQEHVAVLMTDLDRFKNVNDSRGHEAGDVLLQAVAKRLCELAEVNDRIVSLARFGGDEFVMVLSAPPDELAATAVSFADSLLVALREPFSLGNDSLVVGASVGLSTGDGTDSARMLRDADIAMYAAKRAGGKQLAVADDDLRRRGSGQLDLEIGLREALTTGQFVPYFQPIVTDTGELHSFEALVRWVKPSGELVFPNDFLPAAKQAGLLGELSTAMISLVCPIIARWNTERATRGMHPLQIHINCVEEQLCDLSFPEVVASILAEHQVDPAWVLLEVSEETAMDRIPRGTPTLQALRTLGVRFSLDDFGFGNSSLTMLRELGEVAELKLDKSIVDDVAVTGIGADADVVDTILGFAHRRGITIVAEGVEHQEQWDVLRGLGVQLFQGYLFSKPVPEELAETFALNRQGSLSTK